MVLVVYEENWWWWVGLTIAPFCGRLGPDDFQPAGDGVVAVPGTEAVCPAEALRLNGGGRRRRAGG